jgi:hypothetical protein
MEIEAMKKVEWLVGRGGLALLVLSLCGAYSAQASAQSFLDRLKNAAEKVVEKKSEELVEQKTEEIFDTATGQEVEPAPAPAPAPKAQPFKLGGSGSSSGGRNCGALGTTCADGTKNLVACMDQHTAYHYGELLAPALQRKLDAGVFAAGSRADLEFDLKAVKAAGAPPYAKVKAADPAKPHRYLSWLTPQEQADIMNESNRYSNKNREECNAKYARF